jgi:hypothetical protein
MTIMKLKYRLFRRSTGLFFIEDRITKKQKSLRTRDEAHAQRFVNARNEAEYTTTGAAAIDVSPSSI